MTNHAPPAESPFVSDIADQDSERIDLESDCYSKESKARHISRYQWAARKLKERFFRAGRIIDFACGTGYGSAILSEAAHEVYGRDKDEKAIQIADQRYSSTLVNFKVRDKIQRHLGDTTMFDAVVSIETIEHLENPGQFLQACKDLIIPYGMLIISTPLKSPDGRLRSRFHLKEYTKPEIGEMVRSYGFYGLDYDDFLPGFICMTARRSK